MDRQTLDRLCRQLAHWAEDAIAGGRSPFRRAETFFPLLTAAGEISPPLLLWINRDSCMAGGIILFPSRVAEESLAEGRACAEALGLRHFVTWAAQEIVIWEVRGGSTVRSRVLPVAGAGDMALFCAVFRTLLDELKPLSIVGALAPAELAPFYLANLCRLTLRTVTPLLGEAFRIARAERPESDIPATAALQQAYSTLLRQLALLIEDRLPPVIDPEGFDRALRFALDTLPPTLRQPFEIQSWEIPLPPAAAVRLQHLNHRLLQLRFAGDRNRGGQTVEILLQDAAGALGGEPPPALPEDSDTPALLLHPDRCYPAAAAAAEIGAPPLLAFTALLRHLRDEPPVMQAVHPMALGDMPAPVRVRGTLRASDLPGAHERRALATRLRLSWPNRRFRIPAEAPRWTYDFLHLLGLAAEGARITLDLPAEWLTAAWGENIYAVLREQFAIVRLERRPHGVRIDLLRGRDGVDTTVLAGAAGERRIAWAELREQASSCLPLALDLPEAAWLLLRDRHLQIPVNWPAENAGGIYLFSRSSLGRQLWQLVSGGRPLPPRILLPAHLQRHACPLPKVEVLQELQRFSAGEHEPTRAALDRELARWLGSAAAASSDVHAAGRKTAHRERVASEDLLERIRRTVFADGLPRFPEHYLYDHYRPQLIEYRFAGPLALGEEFLGRQNLHDREGMTLTVEGEETARALLLASFGDTSLVQLPADRHLTAKILEKYQANLRDLRQALLRESHRALTDHRRAGALVEKIWESLPLPPWPLIGD